VVLVDALVAVTVDVPLKNRHQDDSQHLYTSPQAGKIIWNGKSSATIAALSLRRNGDIGRIQRQQI